MSYAELRESFIREGNSYLASVAYFCEMRESRPPIGFQAALAAKITHILRDFENDVGKVQQLNISKEELSTYYPHGSNLLRNTGWTVTQVRTAEKLMKLGR